MTGITREELLGLIEEARAGNEGAWKRLRDAYAETLARYVKEFVHAHFPVLLQVTDLDEFTGDVVQEVWEQFLLRLRRPPGERGYDPSRIAHPGSFLKWLREYFVVPKIWELGKKAAKAVPPESLGGDDELRWVVDGETPTPEEVMMLARRVREELVASWWVLKLAFLCGGHPHQQLAFGFSKLIYGKESPRGVEGNPKKVDAEHGATPLRPLGEEFLSAYAAASQLGEEAVRECLGPLRERLPLTLDEIMALDRASSRRYAELLPSRAADTCLRDYYRLSRRGYTAAIPDWSYKLEKRVREVLGVFAESEAAASSRARDAYGRCKLRQLPPCAGKARCVAGDGRGASRSAREEKGKKGKKGKDSAREKSRGDI
ncbi:MAG: hypothetical protein H5T73_09780 [Actinobacteria bacterium]|nr:hypothetical protein [Actinomycetota bacterium]